MDLEFDIDTEFQSSEFFQKLLKNKLDDQEKVHISKFKCKCVKICKRHNIHQRIINTFPNSHLEFVSVVGFGELVIKHFIITDFLPGKDCVNGIRWSRAHFAKVKSKKEVIEIQKDDKNIESISEYFKQLMLSKFFDIIAENYNL